MDVILQFNIVGLPKWEPRLREVIYLGNSPFRAGSVDLVLKPETCHVSLQFHMVFDDELYTISFMREGTIPPNCTDIVQLISYRGVLENIDLNDTWFTPDLE